MVTRDYKTVRAQIEELEAEAELLRQTELDAVISEIREKVQQYGLTTEDIFGRRRRKASETNAKPKAKLPPTHRNAKTGETWSGRGRMPAWLASAKNPNRFLIK